MKKSLLLSVFFTLYCFLACEKSVDFYQLDRFITKNDPGISFRTLNDGEHKYELLTDSNSDYLEIEVENEFSAYTGQIPVKPGKKYKLAFTLKNKGAGPVVTYSFWKSSVTQSRSFTLAGKNGNPPTSETQKIYTGWKTFEEEFEISDDEKSIVIRLFSGKGNFSIREIRVEELN